MPPVSEAQRRWAFANRNKKTKEGKAACEFAAADPGGKLKARATKPTPPNAAVKDSGDASWGNEKFRSARRKILYDHPRSPKSK